jgi:hypothetical protein
MVNFNWLVKEVLILNHFADSPDVKAAKAQFNKAFKDAEEGKVGAQELFQIKKRIQWNLALNLGQCHKICLACRFFV